MINILVVDDEIELCELMEDILVTELNCQVKVAHNGEDALAMTEAEKFDLIITDFKMPSMNGGELIEAVKKSGNVSAQATIFLISGHHAISETESSSFPDVYYFNKPLSIEKMIKKIEEVTNL